MDFPAIPRAYMRLPLQAPTPRMLAVERGSLLFIDIVPGVWRYSERAAQTEVETLKGWLKAVPAEILLPLRQLVLRWPFLPADDGSVREVAEQLLEHLKPRTHGVELGMAVFVAGELPRIVWSHGTSAPEGDDHVLAACRRAELDALLEAGHAIWRPISYHYELPSGRHSSTFVRVADAFRDQRAPEALASWMLGDLRPGTTILLDHGGLQPVAAELAQGGLGQVQRIIALDEYFSTLFQYREALKGVEGGPVLALVSATATGATLERLRHALIAMVGDRFAIHVLVAHDSRTRLDAVPIDESTRKKIKTLQAPWTTLDDPLQSEDGADEPAACNICQDPSRASLVRIDPRTMRVLLLPRPHLNVLDIASARTNRRLWERYASITDPRRMDFCKPIRVPGHINDADPPDARRQMFFEPVFLASGSDAPDWVRERVRHLVHPARERDGEPHDKYGNVPKTCRKIRSFAPTHIVLDSTEYDELERQLRQRALPGETAPATDDHVRALVNAVLELPTSSSVLRYDEDRREIEPTTEGRIERPLVLAFGVHTGITLQRTFLALRSRPDTEDIAAVAIHAHPADPQTWAGIKNTFMAPDGKTQVLALFLTYLPEYSPALDERHCLNMTRQTATDEIRSLVDARLSSLGTASSDASPLTQPLWCPADLQLRPTSFLGEELPVAEALPAVGAALQAMRNTQDWRATPAWEKVNLERLFRSYFDGLILACVLRWVRPSETWWGEDADSCTFLLTQARERFEEKDWNVLLPELLLAAAQGKVPEEAHRFLRSAAQQAIEESQDTALVDWLVLGLAVLDQSRVSTSPAGAS